MKSNQSPTQYALDTPLNEIENETLDRLVVLHKDKFVQESNFLVYHNLMEPLLWDLDSMLSEKSEEDEYFQLKHLLSAREILLKRYHYSALGKEVQNAKDRMMIGYKQKVN